MIHHSLPQRRPNDFSNVIPTVKEIIQKVKEKGDSALYELTEKFDKVKVNSIKVSPKELEDQASRLDEKVVKALDLIYDQIRAFHETTVPPNIGGGLRGISFGILWKSIERIGIYVPGGRHSYPSTLLMAGVPAEVAGVKEIYFASPPNPKGEIDPALAYVALKLKIKEAYKIGGAQAIAALAYGTESVRKVDMIVGLPEESEDDVYRTIELVDNLRPYRSILVPMFFVPMGYFKNRDWFTRVKLSEAHIELYRKVFWHDVYWAENIIDSFYMKSPIYMPVRFALKLFLRFAKKKMRQVEAWLETQLKK
ncbi:histidinol dehydrogenase [Sulfolobus sp. B1]|uniref:histidinol dehydrogenase n=1 Tax=Sulfolobus sp. B1 TaxID=2200888 RepID=UPI00163DCDD0|nr:histidinol dehydrogenase [Sulfolobus sp. B1]